MELENQGGLEDGSLLEYSSIDQTIKIQKRTEFMLDDDFIWWCNILLLRQTPSVSILYMKVTYFTWLIIKMNSYVAR